MSIKSERKMQNFNAELFSRLFFLNLVKSFKIDENFSIVSDQASPSGQAEPPTPPRTPIITSNAQARSAEKNYNNNNDDAKENFEGNSSSCRNTPTKFHAKPVRSESDFGDFPRRSSHFNDDSNYSDHERDGRESVVSGSLNINGAGDESEHEESDCASSFDGSKLSLKNMENFLDKSPMVRSKWLVNCDYLLILNLTINAELLQPNVAPSDDAE